jgi:hypothetical protein
MPPDGGAAGPGRGATAARFHDARHTGGLPRRERGDVIPRYSLPVMVERFTDVVGLAVCSDAVPAAGAGCRVAP